MNSILHKISSEGFAVIPNVLRESEVVLFRQILDDYMDCTYLNFTGGKIVSGWAGLTPELGPMNNLHKDSRITDIVEKAVGEDWIFAEHSDLHQNKITPWHNDVLPSNQADLLRYVHPIVSTLNPRDDGYQIIKVCFLLQNHSDNDYGLWFKSLSNKSQELCIHSNPTDAIVFDQRVEHRGQLRQYLKEHGQHRYLVTMGYGLDNIYTEQHIAGTVHRQNQQRTSMTRNDFPNRVRRHWDEK